MASARNQTALGTALDGDGITWATAAGNWSSVAGNASQSGSAGMVAQCLPKSESEPEMLLLVRYLINEVCVPILVPFGVLANSLNVVVLTRKGMRSSTNCYLTTLAVYDSLYLLFAFFMAFSAYPSIRFEKWFVALRRFVQPMTNVFSNTAVWIVVSFSCERYVAISYPIKGRRWCTISKAKRIIAAICVLCLLITAPEFFCMDLIARPCLNGTDFRLQPNAFHEGLDYYGYYYFNSALFAYVPLFLLTVCNYLLIRAILRSRQLRKAMCQQARRVSGSTQPRCSSVATLDSEQQHFIPAESNGAGDFVERVRSGSRRSKTGAPSHAHKKERGLREQNRLTLMLVIVVVAFLCCHLPAAIGTSIQSYLRHNLSLYLLLRDSLKIYGNISNLLVQLNTASNFILYSMLSTKFRLTFRRIFCKCILSDDVKVASEGRPTSLYTTNKPTSEMHNCSEKRSVRLPSTNEGTSE